MALEKLGNLSVPITFMKSSQQSLQNFCVTQKLAPFFGEKDEWFISERYLETLKQTCGMHLQEDQKVLDLLARIFSVVNFAPTSWLFLVSDGYYFDLFFIFMCMYICMSSWSA